jgi:hypothetical protein
MFVDFLKESVSLWLEVSPYLLLGMFIAGILHVFLGKEFISRHLGKGSLGSILKATLFGIPLPVCSCGVIPLATSLEKDGAHKSSVLAFLVSTPTTGVDSILATYSLMGPLFAIFRPLGALISGFIVGFVNFLFVGKKEKVSDIPIHMHSKIQMKFKIKEVLRYAFYEIPQDIGKWLLVGTLLGGFISVFIPEDIFARFFAFPLDFIIALLVGIPLYVCATGSIPIAVSLISKGFSPGAVLVFLIVGPATNAITLSFVRAKLGKKSFYNYLFTIIITAIFLGLLFNFIWYLFSANPELITGAGRFLPSGIKIISGVILLALIIFALRKPESKKEGICNIKIKVPDIHCQHCKMTLESKLSGLKGIERVFVDVDEKTVNVQGSPDLEEVKKEIKKAGYNPL